MEVAKVKRLYLHMGFPGGSGVKNPPANAGDVGSIPGLGRSPGEESGNPLQCSCLDIFLKRLIVNTVKEGQYIGNSKYYFKF